MRNPKIFLLDEPLSNLDAKLRASMRTEITKLHNKLKTIFIYVTHDQVEAMTMGTRIVVMKDGFIQQIGSPEYLYNHPYNKFVASFIGTPQMNFFKGTINEKGELVFANKQQVTLTKNAMAKLAKFTGTKAVTIGIRPEDAHYVSINNEEKFDGLLEVTIEVKENLGSETLLYCNLNNGSKNNREDFKIVAKILSKESPKEKNIKLGFNIIDLHLFDEKSGISLYKDIESGLFK